MASGIPSPRWGWRDTALSAGIWLFAGLASQRWTGLDTPDSSFYASLSLFGSEVTDRAPFDSYWWTRLGVIAPNHLLTSVLGPWAGFAVWRMLLLAIIVGSAMVILRRFTTTPTAAALTLLISLNTVVLSYLGNPYVTSGILAGTLLVIACALFDGRGAAVLAGGTLGWLVMVNPAGMLLAGVLWLGVRIQRRTRLMHLVIAGVAAILVFAVYWAIGRFMFPGLDWVASILSTGDVDMTVFASKDLVWLHDISLLVPVGILIVTAAVWYWNRSRLPAQLAFLISSASIAFMLVVSPLFGGYALEAPFYQAMLWPPALIALSLSAAAVANTHQWSRIAVAILAVGAVAVLLAGRWSGAIDFGIGVVIMLVLAAFAIGMLLASEVTGHHLGFTVAGVIVLLIGAQLLQNARGPMGLYFLSPYNWAFTANPISDKIHTAVNAQQWLIDNTTRDDRILVWVGGDWAGADRELYVVAGMQLWGGENLATLAPTLDDAGRAKLEELKPSVISMIAPTTERVIDFWQSLPAELNPTPPACYDFAWSPSPDSPQWRNPAPVTQGHSCLTRLTWSQ